MTKRKRPGSSKKPSGSFEAVVNKKAKPENKFDLQYNREKRVVLGKHRVQKQVASHAAASRARGLQRRKECLLPQLETAHKTNLFLDKRIGKNTQHVDPEDAAFQRFSLQRQHLIQRSSGSGSGKHRFNLEGDDEVEGELTHLGQSIGQMEKFTTEKINSDSEDEDLYKSVDLSAGTTTLREKMQGVIARAKQAKFERQQNAEQTIQQTDDLDEKYTDISHLLATISSVEGPLKLSESGSKPEVDEYKMLVETLDFGGSDGRARPSDPLQVPDSNVSSPSKPVLIESEQPESSVKPGSKIKIPRNHVSADSLGETYYETQGKSNALSLSYSQTGQPILPGGMKELPLKSLLDVSKQRLNQNSADSEDSGSEFEVDDGEGQADDDNDDDDDDVDDNDDDDDEDNDSTETGECIIEPDSEPTGQVYNSVSSFPQEKESFCRFLTSKTTAQIEQYLSELSQTLLSKTDYKITCSSLLQNLLHFKLLSACKEPMDTHLISVLHQHVKTLTIRNISASINIYRSFLQTKFESLQNNPTAFPGIDTYILLLTVCKIYKFDSSDVTLLPCIQMLLSRCVLRCGWTGLAQLRLSLQFCELWLNRCCPSSQLIPEVLVCLERVLKVSSTTGLPDDDKQQHSAVIIETLNLLSKCVEMWESLPSLAELTSASLTCVERLLEKRSAKQKKKQKTLTASLEEMHKKLLVVAEKPKPRVVHKRAVDQVKALPMFNPKFDMVLSERRANTGAAGSSNVDEKRKLARRYKREIRGAMREVRRDTAFLQQHKLQQQKSRDKERAKRVKTIYGQLANQEGDVKKSKNSKFQLI